MSPIEAQFSKEFTFTPLEKTAASLPKLNKLFAHGNEGTSGESGDFASLRDELNAVKSKLNRLPLEKWHRHTREVNPAADVVARLTDFCAYYYTWRVGNSLTILT